MNAAGAYLKLSIPTHPDAEADGTGEMVTATVLGYNDIKQKPTRYFRNCLKWRGRGCFR